MGFGVDSAKVPDNPATYPIDINATMLAGEQADIFNYDTGAADLQRRFPGLVAGRTAMLNEDVKRVTGPLDPTVENAFLTNEYGNAMHAFGGGSEGPVGAKGTAGRGAITAGFTKDVLGYQDWARQNLEQDILANPEISMGSGSDAANMAILNTANLNEANTQAKIIKAAQKNADIAASNAQRAAETGAAVSIGSSILGGISSV